jgi:two-component system, NarL family, nitrate/nitrite response regulator NarL
MGRRCLIVDDSRPFLAAATALLDSEGMTVVGCACSGAEALRQARELEPDVVLVDVELGDEDGVAVARRLREQDADVRMLLVSANPLTDVADLVSEAGADGFLKKTALSTEAIEAVCRRPDR